MTRNNTIKPLSLATGAALALSVIGSSAMAAQTNPFGMTELSQGYTLTIAEAKCGQAKCGGNKAKSAEAKCGGNKTKKADAKCGANKSKAAEGKCGAKKSKATESKCGAKKAKAAESKCGSM